MNTYILPCYNLNDGSLWIEKTRAKSFNEAEDKFIDLFVEDYDIAYPSDWDELGGVLAANREIIIGEMYDIEEF